MNKVLKYTVLLFFLLLCCQTKAFSDNGGFISGKLILDDSWERQIYVSLIETFEKEYAISNDLIVSSAIIDSLGNFKVELNKIPSKWSLLRLHIVKKGISPNSLVIGSRDENYFFLIAKRDSEIELNNTSDTPIFKNTRVEGAPYMKTFEYIRKLSKYPNSIDYENSLIEKEFIVEVVSEKLKMVADTCENPLVSLYALYQTNFDSDYQNNPTFYDRYLSKRENEDNTYFKSFRLRFPVIQSTSPAQNYTKYILLFTFIGVVSAIGIIFYRRRGPKIKKLSIQERRIFDLVRKGMSNKEISAECNIELSTVKSHVSNIYSKLNIKSRREAINVKVK